jgi:hypothetical protein
MGYWLVALVLTAFGFIAGFSIGPPFFVVGVAMLILGPVCARPRAFWPALVAVLAFVIAAILVVPLYCVATSDAGGISTTVCSSIIGPSWSGTGLYNPPPAAFEVALRDGLTAGVVAAMATWAWISLRRRAAARS